MLDMGFIHDIRRVIKLLPQKRQNLLFSATYSDDIRGLAERLLHDPLAIQVAPRNAPIELVEQRAYRVQKEQKRHLLVHLIKEGQWHQVLIFTRTKHGANRLTQQLEGAGIKAAAIHGNKSQAARVKALDMFKRGQVTCLVATEVAARGLDIKELPQVVNYELPNVPEDYVHRIGRTGRAGANGEAISLVSADESGLLRDIEKVLRRSIPTLPTPEFKVEETAPPPAREGRPQQNHRDHGHRGQSSHGGNSNRGGHSSHGGNGSRGGHGGHASHQHGAGRSETSSERRDTRRPGAGSQTGTRSFGPRQGRFR
jgi:ATP-dependent RNA helicase RhlE